MANNLKLTLEDKETLIVSRNSGETKAIVKLLSLLVEEQSRAVLQCDLRVSSDRDLALSKARSEGAAKLLRDFQAFLQKSKA